MGGRRLRAFSWGHWNSPGPNSKGANHPIWSQTSWRLKKEGSLKQTKNQTLLVSTRLIISILETTTYSAATGVLTWEMCFKNLVVCFSCLTSFGTFKKKGRILDTWQKKRCEPRKKNFLLSIMYTDCLIRILATVYCNSQIAVLYSPLYTLNN